MRSDELWKKIICAAQCTFGVSCCNCKLQAFSAYAEKAETVCTCCKLQYANKFRARNFENTPGDFFCHNVSANFIFKLAVHLMSIENDLR